MEETSTVAEVTRNSNEDVVVEETEKYEISVEELTIETDSKSIYGKIYRPEAEGEFPAIILSHGYNGANEDFTTECRYYAENGFIAYAYDFCGGSTRSKSSGASTDMTITSEKEDLLDVFEYICGMDGVDGNNVFLFGGSQGGLVTTLAAAERADQVRAVALYFPALCIADDWTKKYTSLEEVPETIDFWGLTLGKGFVEDVMNLDVYGTIGAYKGEVLIFHGDQDTIVPYSYSEKAVDTYENARLIKMEGEGHGFSAAGVNTAKAEILSFMQENMNRE